MNDFKIFLLALSMKGLYQTVYYNTFFQVIEVNKLMIIRQDLCRINNNINLVILRINWITQQHIVENNIITDK